MALHGKIELNGTAVGYWEAVRKERVVSDSHFYDCLYFYRNPQGYPFFARFRVLHSYEMGAGSLAGRVISEGNRKMKGATLNSDGTYTFNHKDGPEHWTKEGFPV